MIRDCSNIKFPIILRHLESAALKKVLSKNLQYSCGPSLSNGYLICQPYENEVTMREKRQEIHYSKMVHLRKNFVNGKQG